NGAGASPTTGTVSISSNPTMYGNITDWRGQVDLGTVYGNVKYRSDIGHCPTDPNCTPNHVLGGGTVTPVTSGGPETMPTVSSCNTLAGNHYTSSATVSSKVTGGASWSYNQNTGAFSSSGGGNPKTLDFAPMTTADDSTHGSDAGYCFSSFTISGGVRLNPSGN